MAGKIFYKGSTAKELKPLDRSLVSHLIQKLESSLGSNPDLGEPLKGKFHGLFKYQIGDYRAIYSKVEDGVMNLKIAHRREVYR